MKDVVFRLLEMNIGAALLTLAVLLIRILVKNAPKRFRYCFWALVALRLILPFSIYSPVSLVPQVANVPQQNQTVVEINQNEAPVVDADVTRPVVPKDNDVAPVNADRDVPAKQNNDVTGPAITLDNDRSKPDIYTVLLWIWLCGCAGLLLYASFSSIGLLRRLRFSVKEKNNVYLCDQVKSPFIFGIFRPRVYLPTVMEEEEKKYVLAHEYSHIRHLDHIWKLFGFLIASVHWFDPFVWFAFFFFCRDMELACDERVIRDRDKEYKKAYASALLSCSVKSSFQLTGPLMFCETGIKERVKNVVSYKKPAFWAVIVSVILVCVLAICFLTDRKREIQDDPANEPNDNTSEVTENTSEVNNTDPILTGKYKDLLTLPDKGLNSLTADEMQARIKAIEDAIADITKNGKNDKSAQNAMLISLQAEKIDLLDLYFERNKNDPQEEMQADAYLKKRFWAMQKLRDYYQDNDELHAEALTDNELMQIVEQIDAFYLRNDANPADHSALKKEGGFVSSYYCRLTELDLHSFYWYYPPAEHITDPREILSFIDNNTTLKGYSEETIVSSLSLISVAELSDTLKTHGDVSFEDLEPNWMYHHQRTNDGKYLLSWVSDASIRTFFIDRGRIDKETGIVYLYGSGDPWDIDPSNVNPDLSDLIVGCFINGTDFCFLRFLPSQTRDATRYFPPKWFAAVKTPMYDMIDTINKTYPGFTVIETSENEASESAVSGVAIARNNEDHTSSTLFVMDDNGVVQKFVLAEGTKSYYDEEHGLRLNGNLITFRLKRDTQTGVETWAYEVSVMVNENGIDLAYSDVIIYE